MRKIRLIPNVDSGCVGKNITAYELGNGCQYESGRWLCMDKTKGCRHKILNVVECKYKVGCQCSCAIAMADTYNLLQQRLEYVVESTRFDDYEKWLEQATRQDRSFQKWFFKMFSFPQERKKTI